MAEPSRRVQRAAHRLADQQRNRFAELPVLRGFNATVLTVTTGAATDGGAVVTVDWRGEEVTAACHLTSYTPAVGDRVTCVVINDQVQILGRNGGFPPEQ